jgi:hypothetical protein
VLSAGGNIFTQEKHTRRVKKVCGHQPTTPKTLPTALPPQQHNADRRETPERVKIVKKHAVEESVRQIAKELDISKSGAQKMIHD